MSTLSLTLPTIGQPDSTEDPKINDAFTAIETWANGNIDATNFVAALSGAFTTYTPTWTTSGTAPAVGNGTLTGRYWNFGKLVVVRIYLLAGSTTTFGTGVWSFALPFAALDGTAQSLSGVGIAAANLAPVGGYIATGGATTVAPFVQSANGASVTYAVPATWTSGDHLTLQGVYERA